MTDEGVFVRAGPTMACSFEFSVHSCCLSFLFRAQRLLNFWMRYIVNTQCSFGSHYRFFLLFYVCQFQVGQLDAIICPIGGGGIDCIAAPSFCTVCEAFSCGFKVWDYLRKFRTWKFWSQEEPNWLNPK